MSLLNLLWWLVLVGGSVAVVTCLEFEAFGWAIAWVVLACGGVWALDGAIFPTVTEALKWLDGHWFEMMVFLALYVGCGGVWSLVKWFFYVHNRADDYELHRQGYQDAYKAALNVRANGGYVPWDLTSFATYAAAMYDFPPSPKRNKARIIAWMWYWPWSAAWTLLNDPINQALSGVMSSISARVFSRFDEFRAS